MAMGQARYRKEHDPTYGTTPDSEPTVNPETGYPGFYPEELIREIKRRETGGFTQKNLAQIYLHVFDIRKYCEHFVINLDNNLYNLEPMRVAFMMLNSTHLGAFAYTSIGSERQEKFDFIGINLATPAILLSNFYKILCSPNSFVGYGENEKEDQDRAIHFLSRITDPDKEFVPPLCPVRKEYAALLTQLSLDFVLFHESAHLYHGHNDWLQKRRKGELSIIDSFTDFPIPTEDLTEQFFEVDADDCALQLTISNILNARDQYFAGTLIPEPKAAPAYHLLFASELDTLKAVLYSMYVLHRSNDYELWIDKLPTGSHPRGLLRARYMFNRFLEITDWLEIEKGNRDYFIDACLSVVFEAEQDLARMEGAEVDKEFFISVIKSANASVHIQAINELQPIVESETFQYVRGDLYPSTALMKTKTSSSIPFRAAKPARYRRPQ
jgi:hypothetical protein